MREHLFKAKRINDEAWVEGYYVKSYYMDKGKTTCYIIGAESSYVDYEGFYPEDEVDPDTVCRYTGLTDKNGAKIFESDIVTSAEFCPDNEGYGVIQWRDDEAMYVIEADNCYYDFDSYFGAELEVIGNIFDDPELIGGVEE